VGFYLALMGLSGGLSVFLPELRGTLVAPLHPTSGTPRLSLQTLQDRILAGDASLRLRTIYPGQSETQPDTFVELTTDKTLREVVMDPYKGNFLVSRKRGDTFYDWVRDLHANLLTRKIGKTINGFGGILLGTMGLSGIVLWWPGTRHLKANSFQLSARKGWRRFFYDFHRLAGVLVLLPLSVAALTGVGLAFSQLAGSTISAVFGPLTKPLLQKGGRGDEPGFPGGMKDCKGGGNLAMKKTETQTRKNASLDDVAHVAQEQIHGATIVRIQAPTGKERGYLVSMHLPSDWRDEGDNRVLVDGQTARVLGVQLGSRMTMSSRVLDGVTGVHYGQYGGIVTRVLALVIGLSLPLLYVSGMLMWWKRITIQRKNPTTNTVSAKAEINAVATR
jgi:uncharacterized iron-regulated membrane protein